MRRVGAGPRRTDLALRVQRRAMIAADPTVCGIDRVELVSSTDRRCVVSIHFMPAASHAVAVPDGLVAEDVRIARLGGPWACQATRLRPDPNRRTVLIAEFPPASRFMENRPGDDAIVTVDHPDVDPLVCEARLSFAADQAPTRDPAIADDMPATWAPVDVDYLAKDYDSYRRLMFDTMASLLPGWTEQHPADIGVAIVETLAYAADLLSYYQDAVGTEAYLSTARRRVSLKRHARLLDYPVHQGCSARAWVRIQVDSAGPATVKAGLPLLCANPSIGADETRVATLRGAPPQDSVIFETMADAVIRAENDVLSLHEWGGRDFTLGAGEVCAALAGTSSTLARGDVVMIVQVKDPLTGDSLIDVANPTGGSDGEPRSAPRCHPVRLTRPPAVDVDPLTRTAITWIFWSAEDAPDVDFPVSKVVGGKVFRGLSVVLGNIVPADIGCTLTDQVLDARLASPVRFALPRRDLIHAVPYGAAAAGPASDFAAPDPLAAVPAITLTERPPVGGRRIWRPVSDLLGSDRFARDFVADVEDDGTTTLRFGDNRHGLTPADDDVFSATFRVGAADAKVGAGVIESWAPRAGAEFGADLLVRGVWNPRPAVGGHPPVSADQIRLHAPRAFRTQARCVIPSDYVDTVSADPRVASAVAIARWTGAWNTTFVSVQPADGLPPSTDLLADLAADLAARRIIGSDCRVVAPDYVPLRVEVEVMVAATYEPTDVGRRVAAAIRALHPVSQATFAQVVYLSPITAAVMSQSGVTDVSVRRFERLLPPHDHGLGPGLLAFGATEIPVLDDDPDHPDHGEIIVRDAAGGPVMTVVDPLANPPPRRPTNRRGLTSLRFRIATQPQFRDWMLSTIGGKAFADDGQTTPPLRAFDASDPDGFVFALISAWAAVGDNLAFYQERIFNEGFLATATEEISVRALSRAIGYAPRPAVSAQTSLAFTLEGRGGLKQLSIPRGTSVQSIPRPGEAPLTFETDEDLEAASPAWNALNLLSPPSVVEPALRRGATALRVAGVRKVLQPDAMLIFVSNAPGPPPAMAIRLSEVTPNVPRNYTDLAWSTPLQIVDDQWDGRVPPAVDPPPSAPAPPQAPPHPDILVCTRTAALFGANAPAWDSLPDTVKATVGDRVGATRISVDAGAEWGPNATGLPAGDVAALAIDAKGVLYALAADGVFRLPKGAFAWSSLAKPSAGSRLTAIAIGSGGALVVGTQKGEVFRSEDDGASWYPLAGPLGQIPPAGQSARLPTTPITALLSLRAPVGQDIILAGAGSGVWRLAGPGGGWIASDTNMVTGAIAAPAPRAAAPVRPTPPGLDAATTSLISSLTAALSKALTPPPPPPPPGASISVRALLVGPNGYLLAATDQGLFSSRPPPASMAWTRAKLPSGLAGVADVYDLTCMGTTGPLFAATAAGLFMSSRGEAWVLCQSPLAAPGASAPFRALAATSKRVFAAGDAGVFFSDQEGKSWRAVEESDWAGMPVAAIAATGDTVAISGRFTGYGDADWPGMTIAPSVAGPLALDLDRTYAGLETGSWMALMGPAGDVDALAVAVQVLEVSKRVRRDFGISAIVTHVVARVPGRMTAPIDPRTTSVGLLTQTLDPIRFTYDRPRVLIFPIPGASAPPDGGVAGDPTLLSRNDPLPAITLDGAIEGLAGRAVAVNGQPARLRIVGRLGGVRMADITQASVAFGPVGGNALNTTCLFYTPGNGLMLGTPFNVQSIPTGTGSKGLAAGARGASWAMFGENFPPISCNCLVDPAGLTLPDHPGASRGCWTVLAGTDQGIWVGGRDASGQPLAWWPLTRDLDQGADQSVNALCVVGSELLAGGDDGLFSSVAGSPWNTIWSKPGAMTARTAVTSLVVLGSGAVVAGTAEGGVLRRATASSPWIPAARPPEATRIWALAASPWDASSTRIYAATDRGLYASPDGNVWSREPMPPGPADVRAVAVDSRGNPWSAIRGRGVLDGANQRIFSLGIGNDISTLLFVDDLLFTGSRLGAPLLAADGSIGQDLSNPASHGVITSPFLADWLNNEGPVTDDVRRLFEQPNPGVLLPPDARIARLPDAIPVDPSLTVDEPAEAPGQGSWRIELPGGVDVTVTYVGESPPDAGATVHQYRVSLAAPLSILAPPAKPDPSEKIQGDVSRWTLDLVSDESTRAVVLDTLPDDVAFGPASEDAPTVTEISRVRESAISLDRLSTTVTLHPPLANAYDAGTVSLNANVVPASHGATVSTAQIIGSGDSSAGQSFVVTSAPVSVLPTASGRGLYYQLDVSVRTSGAQSVIALSSQLNLSSPGGGPAPVPWRQVESLETSSPTDTDYTVTRNDAGQFVVTFGDGVNGKRLPTGRDNVIASYRVGSGAAGNLEAGRLTLLTRRPAGVKSVTNPTPAVGGADGDHLLGVRINGPVRARALDRAVSRRDLEPFLLAIPGVAKAKLREMNFGYGPVLHFTVAFDDDAGTPAGSLVLPPPQIAPLELLRRLVESGPRKPPIRLSRYRPAWFDLAALLEIGPAADETAVKTAAQAALADRFGFSSGRLGGPVLRTEIILCLQAVDGVTAVFVEVFCDLGAKPESAAVLEAGAATLGPTGILGAELRLLNAPATLATRRVTSPGGQS